MRVSRSAGRAELIRSEHFILAARDFGYRSPTYALAELVDNSIQAGASEIAVNISVTGAGAGSLEVAIVDNGAGMDADILRQALRFGGTSRFDDRSSLGRYGMGLPSGALALARKITINTWRPAGTLAATLDVDEIASGRQSSGSEPELVERDELCGAYTSGTLVRLSACDRIEYRRPANFAKRLRADFGRMYRRFIESGLTLTVNGRAVSAVDHLFLDRQGRTAGTREFGAPLKYELASTSGKSGRVIVKFSELPVENWSTLSASEKRALGVSAGSCISVLRSGREIDRGWYFMGTKRRENYDDWWRCEISFDPELDELFGITHTKQQIAPREKLIQTLSPDIEAIGRALNSRIRRRFDNLKHALPLSEAERKAARANRALPSMPLRKGLRPKKETHAAGELVDGLPPSDAPYRILVGTLDTTTAYELLVRRGQLILILNDHHPFFRDLYGPLSTQTQEGSTSAATYLALTMLAAARAEAGTPGCSDGCDFQMFRKGWSDALAAFFNA